MGKPVGAGTRVTVESIWERLAAGESETQIIAANPRLTSADIRAARLPVSASARPRLRYNARIDPDAPMRELTPTPPTMRELTPTPPRTDPDAPKLGDSFLTHIPVLLAINRGVPVKRVLELGCGPYSSLTFLDRACFRDLEGLDSLENSGEWANKVTGLSHGDRRLNMRIVNGALADVLGEYDLDSYDLIFVDDALTREERSRTITAIAASRPRHAAPGNGVSSRPGNGVRGKWGQFSHCCIPPILG